MTTTTEHDRNGAPARRGLRRLSGIRMRVVTGYVVLVTATLTIAVGVTWVVLASRLDRDIEVALSQEVEELRLLATGTDPDTGEPFGDDVEAIFRVFLSRSVPADHEAYYSLVGGEPFLFSFDAPSELLEDDALVARWAAVERPERWTADTAIGEVRMLAVPMQSAGEVTGVFVVTYLPGPERSDMLQAVRVIALAGLVVTVISAFLAWSLAGRVLRPVRQLTSTARSITDADLSGRIPVEGDDELAELGRTFNDMVERLEHGFRSQRQFLDDVAHELRTPITIAQGHLELLGDDPDEAAETTAIVREELDRMSRYVSDLLVLAKAEQPDFLRLELVDLSDLATDVLQRVRALGDRAWVLDVAPPPASVVALVDAARIEQALLNLAENAVKHSEPGAEIGIGVRADGGWVHFAVRDTGDGIDPALADSLFHRYTRGVNRWGRDAQGMGIGLSIVAAIAHAHGGDVDVESTPGHGATFTISVPLQIDAAGDIGASRPTPPRPLPPPAAPRAVSSPGTTARAGTEQITTGEEVR